MSDIPRYDVNHDRVGQSMTPDDHGEWVYYEDVAPLLAELERLRNLKSYILDELSDCMDSGCDSIESFELLETMEKLRLIRKVPYNPKSHGKNLMDTIEPGEEIYWWGER